MQRLFFLGLLILLPMFSGCTAYQAAGAIQRGRPQLMYGDPKIALQDFQRASEIDAHYIMRFSAFDEGVWTYVGRANYSTGQLPAARQALDRALTQDSNDNLARLYLGMTLAKDGDRSRGAREIEGGLKGIFDGLEHITYYTNFGKFWDPRREIRNEIQSSLGMLSGKEFDWEKLISSGEWVGNRMEAEVELARRDEFNDITTQMGAGGQP